jgi:hypothetical protein
MISAVDTNLAAAAVAPPEATELPDTAERSRDGDGSTDLCKNRHRFDKTYYFVRNCFIKSTPGVDFMDQFRKEYFGLIFKN